MKTLIPLWIASLVACFATVSNAQIAEVRGVNGEATYTVANSTPVPVRKGTSLPAGALIKTGRSSALDLFLGPSFGTIRVTQNTTISLDKLETAKVFLTLWDGSFVGWDAKVPGTASFQVKLAKGIVGIVEGKYRLDSRSYLVLLSGQLVHAYVMPDGELKPFTLQAPPAVYFSPVEGVKSAPGQLQREVDLQTKGRLR